MIVVFLFIPVPFYKYLTADERKFPHHEVQFASIEIQQPKFQYAYNLIIGENGVGTLHCTNSAHFIMSFGCLFIIHFKLCIKIFLQI